MKSYLLLTGYKNILAETDGNNQKANLEVLFNVLPVKVEKIIDLTAYKMAILEGK